MVTCSIIVGLLVVGIFARFIWPREEAGGLIMMLALGIAGTAIVGIVFLLFWHQVAGDTKVPRIVLFISMAVLCAFCMKGINYLWRIIRVIRWRLRKWL